MSDQNVARIDDVVANLDADIRDMMRQVPIYQPTLPPHQHVAIPTLDDVGRLSAETMAMAFEQTAKHFEDMGRTLTDEVKSCETHMIDAAKELERFKEMTQQAVDNCKIAADAYRAQAKALFDHIQTRAVMADKARQACLDMVAEIKI